MEWISELLECDDCAYSYRSVHPKGLYDLVCPNCGNMAKHNKIYDTQAEEIEEAFREVKRIRDGGIPKQYLQDFNLHSVAEEEREMTIQQAIKLLENHNKWRRGDDTLEMAEPKDLGIAIDLIVEHLKTKENERARLD